MRIKKSKQKQLKTNKEVCLMTLSKMKRKNQKYGMVTMCVGAGQGAAGIFEIL